MGHGCEIVSLAVPHDLLNDVLEGDLDHLAAISIVFKEGPLLELLLLLIKDGFFLIYLLSLVNYL